MEMTGAKILIECLKAQGVDTIFGYPGSSVLEIYDELYNERENIRHILTSHEQGAAHAADGYARTTKKVGVCIATSGPGATNLVTGIATAYMDSVPIIAITCNVEQERLGKDSFQEVDITGITMPVTKHGMIIKEIEMLPSSICKAFRIAIEKRPGPVILDITKDVLTARMEFNPDEYFANNQKNDFMDEMILNSSDLIHVVRFLKQSKKPLILAGGGAKISGAGEIIMKLANLLNAPVAVSLMGKGVVDEDTGNYLGMVGIHGTHTANKAVSECDLLVALGIRFSDRMTANVEKFAPKAQILQIDIDPAEINKNVMIDLPIIGDVKQILCQICDKLKPSVHKQWWKDLLIEEKSMDWTSCGNQGINIIKNLCELTEGNAIITTEVGQHQMLAAKYYKIRKGGEFLTSGGLGTMGYGLSAAIGAKLGNPEKTVINLAGDGCFRMNMNELLTASRHKIPIIQVVFDNQILGLVYQWQRAQYNSRFSETEFHDRLDFVKLAKALGVKAYRINNSEDSLPILINALKEAEQLLEPIVIDCILSKNEEA